MARSDPGVEGTRPARTSSARSVGAAVTAVGLGLALGFPLALITGCATAPPDGGAAPIVSTTVGAGTTSSTTTTSTTTPAAATPTVPPGDLTSTTTPPPDLPPLPTRYYEDPDRGFSFEYPKGWKLTEAPRVSSTIGGTPLRSVGVFDPTGSSDGSILLDGTVVSTFTLQLSVTDELVPAYRAELEELLVDLEGRLQSFETVAPLAPRAVPGGHGFETTFRFTHGGRRMRSHMVFVAAGARQYQITSQASDGGWDSSSALLAVVPDSFQLER